MAGEPEIVVEDTCENWIREVEEKIHQEWIDFLSEESVSLANDDEALQDPPQTILDVLRTALRDVHQKHTDENGKWCGTPKEDEIFSWTSCPPKKIRAIILLLDPLEKERAYESTGYALGVRRRREHEGAEISSIPTFKNLFEILGQFKEDKYWTADKCRRTMEKYNAGFDPSYLSSEGILFLNYSLTKGENQVYDIVQWRGFFEAVMDAIGRNAIEKIPVIQLYNNKQIQTILKRNEEKFCVYRPAFMDVDEDADADAKKSTGNRHVGYFHNNPRCIPKFVAGIKQNGACKEILDEIATEVIDGENLVDFPI